MVAAIGFKEVLWSLSICFLLALAAKILFASLFVLKDARDKAGVWNAEVESLNDEQIRSGGEMESGNWSLSSSGTVPTPPTHSF